MEDSKLYIEEKSGLVRCSECGYERSFKYEGDFIYHVPTQTVSYPKCGAS